MESLSAARNAALKALYETDKNGAYLNAALRNILANSKLDVRDSALAMQIATGVEKNRLFIDNIIANLSTVKMKKLSVWILNILRIGIYSIKFLDKIPISATVNECVRLSRRYGHNASAGFVNAVLRKAASSGDFLPDESDQAEYISIKYSFPKWLVKMWLEAGYGEELFRSMNAVAPVYVRMNTLKTTQLGQDFKKSDVAPHAYIYTGNGSVENTREYRSGKITVQDAASQIAVQLLNVGEGMTILDLCAAPGGKTTYIAQMMNNVGSLTSCDIYPHKLKLIENNLKRLGITNTKVAENDAAVFNTAFEECFDRVLADVPCSGLGIIRRKPDIKWTKDTEELSSLIPLQRKILDNAARYVKHGGRLVFSTCTINKAENEDNVSYFLNNHSDFVLLEGGQQLLPYKDGTDGFFMSSFERK